MINYQIDLIMDPNLGERGEKITAELKKLLETKSGEITFFSEEKDSKTAIKIRGVEKV
jgi:hypothetical protein